MGTIIDYLMKWGKYSLKENPFNDVDSLLLCQLSYLKFDGIVPELGRRRKNVGMLDAFSHKDRERMFSDERYEIPNKALFEGMAFSRRFQNMKMNHYVTITDVEREIQFAAVTFFLDNGMVYVAYRGTDETIIGWKEDFNMAFKSPVPSQVLSARYLNRVGQRISGKFMVGGHSKGGNLAVYASMKCKEDIQDRIDRVYTNDGPGFVEAIFSSQDFAKIENRITKIVPQSSLVGMLLQHQEKYQVIESMEKGGVKQHDPYTWEVKNGDFIRKNDINQGRKLFNKRLNEWVQSLDEGQRMTFVETLYQIITVTEAETLIDLTEEWRENSLKMVNALKDMDGETKKALAGILKALFAVKRKKKADKT